MNNGYILECDICHDKIHLYQPWYSVKVKGRLAIPRLKTNPMHICVNCFHAYENFLTEREVQENHRKNWHEVAR